MKGKFIKTHYFLLPETMKSQAYSRHFNNIIPRFEGILTDVPKEPATVLLKCKRPRRALSNTIEITRIVDHHSDFKKTRSWLSRGFRCERIGQRLKLGPPIPSIPIARLHFGLLQIRKFSHPKNKSVNSWFTDDDVLMTTVEPEQDIGRSFTKCKGLYRSLANGSRQNRKAVGKKNHTGYFPLFF